MKADRISVDKFQFENIVECKGRKAFNEHGYLIICGVIKQEMENEYLKLILEQEKILVSAYNLEGEKINLFHGILYEAKISHKKGVPLLRIHLKTGSYLADIGRHIRSFQRCQQDIRAIAETCLRNYPGGNFILSKILPATPYDFLMQYEETDWEFLVRVVSGSNTVVLPDDETGDVKFYLGLPQFSKVYEIESEYFSIHKSYDSLRGSGLWEETPIYEVKTREIYRVGEHIRFLGKLFIIGAVETEMERGELVHIYYLIPESGITKKRIYNKRLAGNAIGARVVEVKKESVKISIDRDEADNGEKRLFPYATAYSTPDGTGWYCMPEIGDQVRLYFPTEKEEDAYVESSVHLETADQSRKNPQEKSFMNRQRKEILFTPDSLMLRNNNGLSIELLDGQGIKIISDKSVFINADNSIQLISNSGEIEMIAADSIEMKQGNARFQIADKITMEGGKINLN